MKTNPSQKWKYNGLPLSRLPPVSKISLSRTTSLVFLDISTKYTLIFSLYLKSLYLELLSISNEHFGSVATTFSLSQSFYLHVL